MLEPMAMSIEHHRMTVAEFERYCDDHPDENLELIDGEIHTVSPQSELHSLAVVRVLAHLQERHPAPMRVMPVGSVRIDGEALWEPDVYVYEPDPDRDPDVEKYPDASEVVLVVEISLHTVTKDMGSKYFGYARNFVPEYWVIDPRPRRGVFHRFTNPSGGTYRTVESTPLPDGIKSLEL